MPATSSPTGFVLPEPDLEWAEGGPRSREAGDVYFSAEDGLAESRAVFLAGCGLPERFAPGAVFTIGELGFGTGLNALAVLDLWRRHRPAGARLHMVSLEARPFRREQARRALSAFPELAGLASRLLSQWPPPLKGLHRLHFDAEGFTLSVVHGAAPHAMEALEFAADAWFLDGFAPSANPDMWSGAVFAEIARLSKPGARAATFTVAGAVRRGLAEAGFTVAKRPGFGRKRERLEAVLNPDAGRTASGSQAFPRRTAPPGERIAVLGGGIAAASLVRAFARRGVSPTVFAAGGWSSGASGAPTGLLTPRLEAIDRPHARALLNAFDYARRLYGEHGAFRDEGILRCARDPQGEARLKRIASQLDEDFEWLGADAAEARTGVKSGRGGLWMARAGRFDPTGLVTGLSGVQSVRTERISSLERLPAGWRLLDVERQTAFEADTLVLAGGAGMDRLAARLGLALETTAGHVILADGSPPSAPVAWGGYLAAAPGGVMLGATHIRGSNPGLAEEADASLRADLAAFAPSHAGALGATRSSWAGVRAAMRDRLPICGPVPLLGADGAGLPDQFAPRLYVLSGFGARGFAHAPLLAEALVSDLLDEPAGLERSAREALHPARFPIRAARRG
ncbi:MAG: tRNA (5-methylaminomethyl-2-thiouridine)(34)-methyltransferase MnmD [Pseudomonadota bacterium]